MTTSRRKDIADAAIAVLADAGARGLTHRAVDARLGLPPGSTSYYFRTRNELLAAANTRLIEVDRADVEQLAPADATATGLAELVIWWCSPVRRGRVRARFELYLEADRNLEIREKLREPRESFIAHTQAALTALGAPASRTLAITVNAVVEGLLLNEIAGATPVDETKLRALLGALTPSSPKRGDPGSYA